MANQISIKGPQSRLSGGHLALTLIPIFLSVASIILRFVGHSELLAPTIATLIFLGLVSFKKQTRTWVSIENALMTVNFVIFLALLIGEFDIYSATSRKTISIIGIFLYLGVSTALQIHRDERDHATVFFSRQSLKIVAVVTIVTVLWMVLKTTPFIDLLRFLGYGYDNAHHLAQARQINESFRSYFFEEYSDFGLLSNIPQVAGAFLAVGFAAVSDSNSITDWLAFYVFASVLLALVAILLVGQAIANRRNKVTGLLVGLALIVSFIFGHLGRIWVNGFFASNLATLFLCIFVRNNLLRSKLSVTRGFVQTAIVASIWPLLGLVHLLVVAFLLVPALLKQFPSARLSTSIRTIRLKSPAQSLARVLVVALALMQVALTYISIRRYYSVSHFLADGGIEAANLRAYLVGTLLLIAAVALSAGTNSSSTLRITGALFVTICITFLITYWTRGYVNYYSTKTVVGSTTALAVATSCVIQIRMKIGLSRLRRILTCAALTGFAALQLRLAPPQAEMTFSTAFQGRISNSVISALEGVEAVVDSEAVDKVVKQSCGQDEVLFISDSYDSELTTRWMNSSRSLWNGRTWSNWQSVRASMEQEDWSSADSLIVDSKMVLVVGRSRFDDEFAEKVIAQLPRSESTGRICVL